MLNLSMLNLSINFSTFRIQKKIQKKIFFFNSERESYISYQCKLMLLLTLTLKKRGDMKQREQLSLDIFIISYSTVIQRADPFPRWAFPFSL